MGGGLLWAPPRAQSRAARHGCGAPPRVSPTYRLCHAVASRHSSPHYPFNSHMVLGPSWCTTSRTHLHLYLYLHLHGATQCVTDSDTVEAAGVLPGCCQAVRTCGHFQAGCAAAGCCQLPGVAVLTGDDDALQERTRAWCWAEVKRHFGSALRGVLCAREQRV